jgi:hypothetical protein
MDGQAGGGRQQAAGGTRPSIELRIDALVLRGFAPGDRHRIGEAVERELARLLAQEELPPLLARPGQRDGLDAGPISVRSGVSADAIGAEIAQSVFRGLGQ